MLYAAASGIPGIVNFLALALYTRLLAPQEYGRYALVIAWVSLASAILFQWLRLGARRFLIGFTAERTEFLATVVAIYLALVVLTGTVAAVGLVVASDPLTRALLGLGTILLWTQAWTELNLELVMAALLPARYGILALVRALVAVGTGGTLAALGYGAGGVVIGVAAGFLVPGAWMGFREWRGVRIGAAQRRILRLLLRYGLPLTATCALEFVISASDRLLLGWLSGPVAVGSYAVAYDLGMQGLTMIMVNVNLAAFPMAVRAMEQGGPEAARRQLDHQSLLLFSIALPAATGLALLAPNVSHTFLGAAFREPAMRLIPWVALAAFFFGIKSLYFDLGFQLGRATLDQIWVSAAAATVNIVLNLWLIPSLGALGAAYATVAAYAVGLGLSWWRGRRIFAVPLRWSSWGGIAAAVLLMAAGLWPVLDYRGLGALVLQVTWGGALFLGGMVLLDVGGIRTWLARRHSPA